MDVFTNESVKKIEAFCEQKQAEYGEIERIILAGGTVRIMEPNDPIPVPMQPAAVRR
jgi:Tfp pilus assembly PilM family ATPase